MSTIEKFENYSRGFIASTNAIKYIPDGWSIEKVLNLNVVFDKDNDFYSLVRNGRYLIILGTVVDIKKNIFGAVEVLPEIFDALLNGEKEFFDRIDWLNGRFVLIFGDVDDEISTMKVLNDATGMRSVFFTENLPFYYGSHPDLVARQCDAGRNNYGRFLSKYTGYSLPGNLTTFDGVRQLIPNHYVDLATRKHCRFFPRAELVGVSEVDSVLSDLAENLRIQVELLSDRIPILCSLSAGIDSRVTLSATRNVADKVKYFTYFGKSSDFNSDILSVDKIVAEDISKNLRLNHLLIDLSKADENEKLLSYQKKIGNPSHVSHNKMLAACYLNIFGKNNYLHLRSNLLEIGRLFFRSAYKLPKQIDSKSASYCYSPKAENDFEVVNLFEDFLNTVRYDLIKGYDHYDLFYWEYRMAMWHSLIILESDPVFETYILFNNRKFLEKLLSIKAGIRSDASTMLKLCQKNWEATTFFPVNEVCDSFSDKLVKKLSEIRYISLSDCDLTSVSDADSFRKPEFSLLKAKKNISFAFIDSAPLLGDKLNLRIKLPALQQVNGCLVLNIKTPYANVDISGRIKYSVLLNEFLLGTSDVSSWHETNQIAINLSSFYLKKNSDNFLCVEVFVVKDCEPWNWGKASTIIIEGISMQKIKIREKVQPVTSSNPFMEIYPV